MTKQKIQDVISIGDLSSSKKDEERLVFLCDITLEDFDKFRTLPTFDVMRGFINTFANHRENTRVGSMYFSYKKDGSFEIVFKPRFRLDDRIVSAVDNTVSKDNEDTYHFFAYVTNVDNDDGRRNIAYRNPYQEENPYGA